MFDRIKKTMSKGIWHSLAVIIVMLIAGPEIIVNMELMAMVELLGASTFVLMYVSGLKLFYTKVLLKYKHFERHSFLFIPSLSNLKQMPCFAIHAIPERTFSICFVGFMIVCMSHNYINMLICAYYI